MASLDLSECTDLGNVTSFDISNNGNLTYLDISSLYGLSSISVASTGNLAYINISNTKLTTIDTSGMYNIETYIAANATNLTEINFYNSTGIKTLNVSGSTLLVGKLDFSNQSSLKELDISGLDISSLDFVDTCKDSLEILKINETLIASFSPTNYSALKTLECKGTQITTFSANNSALEYIDLSRNEFLTQINVEQTTYVKTLIADDCSALASLYIWDNVALETISARNNTEMGHIQPQGNQNLKVLDLTGATKLTGGCSIENSGNNGGGLTVIVTGTSLTDSFFTGWNSTYMTLENESQ